MGDVTFAGLPRSSPADAERADIAIIGLPHGTPYGHVRGSHSAEAPCELRRASQRFVPLLDNYDFDLGGPLLGERPAAVLDLGDVEGSSADPAGNRRLIRETLSTLLGRGLAPVVLGGDDSVPIPFLEAFERHGPLTVVQIDAHLDWKDSVSGERYGYSSTMRRASEMQWVRRIIQVGMRGVGSAGAEELEAARAWGVCIITAQEVVKGGAELVLNNVPRGEPCIITLDCDGLDPSIMPAVRAPLPGGLDYHLVLEIIHGVAHKAKLMGFDLVEFAPANDLGALGALTAVRILLNVVGALARTRFPQET